MKTVTVNAYDHPSGATLSFLSLYCNSVYTVKILANDNYYIGYSRESEAKAYKNALTSGKTVPILASISLFLAGADMTGLDGIGVDLLGKECSEPFTRFLEAHGYTLTHSVWM